MVRRHIRFKILIRFIRWIFVFLKFYLENEKIEKSDFIKIMNKKIYSIVTLDLRERYDFL